MGLEEKNEGNLMGGAMMKRVDSGKLENFILTIFALSIIGNFSQAIAGDKDFFKGKTLKVITQGSAGGGTDAAARIVARFMPRYLPGHPKTFVQNIPGAGGIPANNYFARKAKPDGLTIFQAASSTLTQYNRGGKRIGFDPRKYVYIGSIRRGGSVLMIAKEARRHLSDSKANPVVVGDPDGSRGWLPMPLFGAEYLGWNVRFIVGYSGSADMILALRQGELHMIATANATLINDLVKDNVVDLLTQQGRVRRRDFPDVPSFLEVLGNKRPSGIPWRAYNVWAGPSEIDKFLVMPPGTPGKLVKMFRNAFLKMVKDPEAIAVTNRFYGKAWAARGAKETVELAKEITGFSKEVTQYLRDLRKKYGLPKS